MNATPRRFVLAVGALSHAPKIDPKAARPLVDGLILGRHPKPEVREPVGFGHAPPVKSKPGIITYKGDGHLITFARTGAGKTVGPVISNLLTYPGQVVALDIKGEVYDATWRRRQDMGQRVHAIDLRDDFKGIAKLNPLDLAALCGRETDVSSRRMACDIIARTGQEKDPFWNNWGEILIAGAIDHFMHASEAPALSSVFDLLFVDDLKMKLALMLDQRHVKSQSARSAFNAFLSVTGDLTACGISSTAQQAVRLFGDNLIRRLTSMTTIDLDALIAGDPMTIYIIVPPHLIEPYKPVLRLWLSGLIMAFTLRKQLPAYPTLMMCDEMAQLGFMQSFVMASTLLRGSGVKLWSIFQSPSQLHDYGHHARTIIDNAGVIQFFGASNLKSATDFCDLVGGITPAEVLTLPPDEQFLLIEGGLPKRAKQFRYYNEAMLKGLYPKPAPQARGRER
jgi:type IV secretion system protein VirD4